MQRLRLVLLLGLVVALGGAVVANGQDGTSVFNDSTPKSDAKQEKTKAKAKDNSGHRKHWYSLPHWFHKKHDKNSTASKSKANPFDKHAATNQKIASTESKPGAKGTNQKSATSNTKTVASAKPAGKAVATTNSGASGPRKHWYSLPDWFNSGAKTGGTAETKTGAAVHRVTKTATDTKHRGKTAAGASQGKKAVRHDCTPELAKKGGCTVDKAHSKKASTNPS